MSDYETPTEERTDHDRTDPETEFTDAERELIENIIQVSNDAVLGDDCTAYRAAVILRATADCLERHGTDTPSVSYRLREALGNPGSYLPADVVDERGERL